MVAREREKPNPTHHQDFSGGTERRRLRSVFWALFSIAVFIGIPFFLGLRLIDDRARAEVAESRKERASQMRQILSRTAVMGNPETRFQRLMERLSNLPIQLRSLAGRLARVTRDEGGILEILLFDSEGNPLPFEGSPTLPRKASRRFMEALKNPGKPENDRIFSAFCGNRDALGAMSPNPGCFMRIGNLWNRAWGGWWPLRTRKGRIRGFLVAFVNLEGMDRPALFDRAIQEVRRVAPRSLLVGWWDPAFPDRLRPAFGETLGGSRRNGQPSRGTASRETASRGTAFGRRVSPGSAPHASLLSRLTKILRDAGNRPNEFSLGGRLGVMLDCQGGQRLFCLESEVSDPDPGTFLNQALLTISAIAGALLLAWATLSAGWFIGLRSRIILILLGGGSLLAGSLMTAALVDRRFQESRLKREFQQRHMELLERLDRAFLQEVLRCIKPFEEFASRLEGKTIPEIRAALPDLARLVDSNPRDLASVNCVDVRNRSLFRRMSPKSVFAKANEAMGRILENFSSQAVSGFKLQDVASGVPQTARFEETSDGAAGSYYWIIRRRGKIQKQTIMDIPLFTFTELIRGPDGAPSCIIFLTLDRRYLQRRFLSQWFLEQALAQETEGPRPAAIPMTRRAPLRAFPRIRTMDNLILRRVADQVMFSQVPQYLVGAISNREYLLTAIKGTNLEDYVLLLAQPHEVVLRGIRGLDRRLWALTVSLLVLGVLAAHLFSSKLLGPLSRLGEGLFALKNRDFEKTVRIGGISELDRIGNRLSEILGDLRDLKIARSVQENLWPEKPASGEGWSVHGICRTATNLGGDFFDWFTTPEGRLVFAVGDVAGHGIPASLVTAAAKMGLILGARSLRNPGEILEAMNAEFREQGGRFRPMSLWLGILDPGEMKLSFSVAGHPFGILSTPTQSGVFLGHPGYPLGIKAQGRFKEGRIDLCPGSRLVLYTDGIIESLDSRGEPFGYDRFAKMVSGPAQVGPDILIESVFQKTRDWSGKTVPEDDQTLLVLSIDPALPKEPTV